MVDLCSLFKNLVLNVQHLSQSSVLADTGSRSEGGIIFFIIVVQHIAQSSVLADTESHSEGGVVFFDFLGLVLVHYPEWIGRTQTL